MAIISQHQPRPSHRVHRPTQSASAAAVSATKGKAVKPPQIVEDPSDSEEHQQQQQEQVQQQNPPTPPTTTAPRSRAWIPLAYPKQAVISGASPSLLHESTMTSQCADKAPLSNIDSASYFPLHPDVLLATVREMLVLDGTLDSKTLVVNGQPTMAVQEHATAGDGAADSNGNDLKRIPSFLYHMQLRRYRPVQLATPKKRTNKATSSSSTKTGKKRRKVAVDDKTLATSLIIGCSPVMATSTTHFSTSLAARSSNSRSNTKRPRFRPRLPKKKKMKPTMTTTTTTTRRLPTKKPATKQQQQKRNIVSPLSSPRRSQSSSDASRRSTKKILPFHLSMESATSTSVPIVINANEDEIPAIVPKTIPSPERIARTCIDRAWDGLQIQQLQQQQQPQQKEHDALSHGHTSPPSLPRTRSVRKISVADEEEIAATNNRTTAIDDDHSPNSSVTAGVFSSIDQFVEAEQEFNDIAKYFDLDRRMPGNHTLARQRSSGSQHHHHHHHHHDTAIPDMIHASISTETKLRQKADVMTKSIISSFDDATLRQFMGYQRSTSVARKRLERLLGCFLYDVSHAMFAWERTEFEYRLQHYRPHQHVRSRTVAATQKPLTSSDIRKIQRLLFDQRTVDFLGGMEVTSTFHHAISIRRHADWKQFVSKNSKCFQFTSAQSKKRRGHRLRRLQYTELLSPTATSANAASSMTAKASPSSSSLSTNDARSTMTLATASPATKSGESVTTTTITTTSPASTTFPQHLLRICNEIPGARYITITKPNQYQIKLSKEWNNACIVSSTSQRLFCGDLVLYVANTKDEIFSPGCPGQHVINRMNWFERMSDMFQSSACIQIIVQRVVVVR